MKRTLVLLSVVACATAPACCGVARSPVDFGGQQNIIVWDADSKTQHFVRVASFKSKTPDMGFLAPTPSVPELKEIDPKVYDHLHGLLPTRDPDRALTMSAGDAKGEPVRGGPVEIVQVTNVGNFVATTFKATDATALDDYLKKYGFTITAPQAAWVKKYVDQKWFITAFQVVVKDGSARTNPIRMTFKTDEPFNPYYVPSDNIASEGAGVALYFISKGTYKGTVGGKNWQAHRFSEIDIPEADRKQIADYLKIDSGQVGDSLTYDVGYSFPERGNTDDVFFALASAETPKMREGLIRNRDVGKRAQNSTNTLIFVGVGLAGVVGFAAFMMARRK
jgi:hypothetical protein